MKHSRFWMNLVFAVGVCVSSCADEADEKDVFVQDQSWNSGDPTGENQNGNDVADEPDLVGDSVVDARDLNSELDIKQPEIPEPEIPDPGQDVDDTGGGNGDEVVEAWTAAHNAARQLISDGKVTGQPKASPALPDLTFDEKLQAVALNYAKKCVWEHNPNRNQDYAAQGGSGYVGENLYASYGGGMPSAETAVNNWFDEHKFYNYENDSCSDVCGHYTQVVWRDTLRVGCAVHQCDLLQGINWKNAWMVVCNYAPAGNYIGQRPY